jgi:nucleoside-diphosphate-sugar epimerase
MASAGTGGEAVCVTGGSGFIGSCLVRLLLRRGYSVHATVKNLRMFSPLFPPLIRVRPFCPFAVYPLFYAFYLICADDPAETGHLPALDGAEERLHLFAIDLLDADSLRAAISGTVGVFHLASPCIVDRVQDPQVSVSPYHLPFKIFTAFFFSSSFVYHRSNSNLVELKLYGVYFLQT